MLRYMSHRGDILSPRAMMRFRILWTTQHTWSYPGLEGYLTLLLIFRRVKMHCHHALSTLLLASWI